MHQFVETNAPGLFAKIREKKELDEGLREEMRKVIGAAKEQFVAEQATRAAD